MTKQDTIEQRRMPTEDAPYVLTIFAEHFRLAEQHMKPEAALHTAYTAAANYLAQRGESEVKGTE